MPERTKLHTEHQNFLFLYQCISQLAVLYLSRHTRTLLSIAKRERGATVVVLVINYQHSFLFSFKRFRVHDLRVFDLLFGSLQLPENLLVIVSSAFANDCVNLRLKHTHTHTHTHIYTHTHTHTHTH